MSDQPAGVDLETLRRQVRAAQEFTHYVIPEAGPAFQVKGAPYVLLARDYAESVLAALERAVRLEGAARRVIRWHYQHSVIEAMDDMIALRALLAPTPAEEDQ